MATEVVMPKMGYDMTEGTVLRWAKREGDRVVKGDVLGEIETGKVNVEIEAFADGVLRAILVGEGQTVPVGDVIAVIAEPGEQLISAEVTAMDVGYAVRDPGGSQTHYPVSLTEADPRATADSMTGPARSKAVATEAGRSPVRLRASPLARRLAAQNGLSLADVRGSGPGGRIVRDDVLSVLESDSAGAAAAHPSESIGKASVAAALDSDVELLPAMRRTIARRLGDSWTTAPHVFLTIPIDMTEALRMRAGANALPGLGAHITVNDVVLLAVARTLRRDPRLNCSWSDGSRIVHKRVNLGVAVSVGDGLFTVVIPDADEMRLSCIAAEVADKAARARAGRLTADDVATPSTFTVSNLGMYGVSAFTAIINPPEAAILAVGAVTDTPTIVDEAVVVRSMMTATLSVDHRVVDGAVGAEFLAALKSALEEPLGLVV